MTIDTILKNNRSMKTLFQIIIPMPLPMLDEGSEPAPDWLVILLIVVCVIMAIAFCTVCYYFGLMIFEDVIHKRRARQMKDKLLNLAERAPTGKEREFIIAMSECLYHIRRGDEDIAKEELERLVEQIKNTEKKVRVRIEDGKLVEVGEDGMTYKERENHEKIKAQWQQ